MSRSPDVSGNIGNSVRFTASTNTSMSKGYSTDSIENDPSVVGRSKWGSLLKSSRVTEQARRSLALEVPFASSPMRNFLHGNGLRKQVGLAVESVPFKMFIACCIMGSMCLAVYETDKGAQNEDTAVWFEYSMGFLTFIYLVEIILRVYALGGIFFRDAMNVFELMVVAVDVAFFCYSHLTGKEGQKLFILRVCRLVRVARIVRLLSLFRPLFLILHGFFAAMQAIIWATILLLVMIGLWSILAVDVLHPINTKIERTDCDRCPRAFESVFASSLSFLETTLAGETWGSLSIPIIEDEPWTIMIFLGVHITVNMGIMNLILAVIVDQANQAREDDHEQQLLEKSQMYVKAKAALYKLCEEMDVDGSGTLTALELMRGVSTVPDFAAILKLMDVRADDIEIVFSILDYDKSGDVDYTEFVEQLHRMKSQDSHSLLIFIKHYVLECRDRIEQQVAMLQNSVLEEDKSIKKILRDLAEAFRSSGILPHLARLSSGPHVFATSSFIDAEPSDRRSFASTGKSCTPVGAANDGRCFHRGPSEETNGDTKSVPTHSPDISQPMPLNSWEPLMFNSVHVDREVPVGHGHVHRDWDEDKVHASSESRVLSKHKDAALAQKSCSGQVLPEPRESACNFRGVTFDGEPQCEFTAIPPLALDVDSQVLL